MQLPLGEDPRTETLRRLQPLLVQRFGRIERAPRERRAPEWVLVQGVIGARTKSEISNEATDSLLAKYGSWEAVAQAALAGARTTEHNDFKRPLVERTLASLYRQQEARA